MSTPPSRTGKQALLDAFSDVMRSQAQTEADAAAARRAAARARTRRQTRLWLLVVLLLSVNGYIWTTRPPWLFPPPAPGESVEIKEASLRIAMGNAARQVLQFQESRGRLPRTLAEAGAGSSGMRYEPRGAEFRLTGVNGPVALTFSSSDSLGAFIGNSYQLISRRAGR